jgi:NADPH2:quinone reductase
VPMHSTQSASFFPPATPGELFFFSYPLCFVCWQIAPENTTFPLGPKTSFEEAATLPLAAMTSAIALFVDLGLPTPLEPAKSPVTLLINGASSSIGSFAVQLAKLANLRVIGIAGAGSSYATECGANHVVDYRDKSAEELRRAVEEYGPFSHAYDAGP